MGNARARQQEVGLIVVSKTTEHINLRRMLPTNTDSLSLGQGLFSRLHDSTLVNCEATV